MKNQPLNSYPPLFGTLHEPSLSALIGEFQGEFIGPAWLRRIAVPGLRLAGLGGWWGKRFSPDGQATNLIVYRGQILPRFPIHPALEISRIDGRPVVALTYAPEECPFPWPYIRDELRILNETTLLGMTYLNWAKFRRLPLPFLLHAKEVTFAVG